MEDSTILQILSGVGVAIVTGFIALWSYIKNLDKKAEKKDEEASLENKRNQEEFKKMSGELGELKGQIHIAKSIYPKLDKLEDIAKQTLEELKK